MARPTPLVSPSRYLRHPPAASSYWADGAPSDSGTAHHLLHNATHLAWENVRVLGHVLGPGRVYGFVPGQDETGYSLGAIIDAAPNTDPASPRAAIDLCSWRTGFDCLRIPANHLGAGSWQATPAGHRVRGVRVLVQAIKGPNAGTLDLVAALTPHGVAPPQADPVAWDSSGSYSTTGALEWDTTLVAQAPVRHTDLWPSSPPSQRTPVWPLDLWLGWRSTHVLGGGVLDSNHDAIVVVAAWEVVAT